MSFILDALRKSEHARQRETGPGLAEIPVAPSRPKKNLWATAAVALLLVNLLAVGVLLLRRAQQDEAPVAAANTAPASAGHRRGPGRPAADGCARAGAGHAGRRAAPCSASRRGRGPQSTGRRGRRRQCRALAAGGRRAHVPDGPPAVTRTGQHAAGFGRLRAGTRSGGPALRGARARGATGASAGRQRPAMPGADEVIARGGVPPLHLDLHVYASQPQQRFVFVNSRKYREGDTLAEGPVVEQITPDGAVLNFRGSRFRLSND